jgi:anthranilate synthase component I
MNYNEFKSLSTKYKTIPVYKRIIADLLTPISAYMRLTKNAQYSFIFESVEKGEQYGRYSFIGKNPDKVFKSLNQQSYSLENNCWGKFNQPFLDNIRDELKKYHAPKLDNLPHFTGGFVGNLGYESIQWIEEIPIHVKDEIQTPDAVMMLFNEIIAFDHLKNEIILFSNVHITPNINLEKAYSNAHDKIDLMGEALHTDIDYQSPIKTEKSDLHSNFTKSEFIASVNKAKEYIKSGDIFQLVLSQQFNRKSSSDAITLYRALRIINPSPYMFLIHFEDINIIGASPELLVKVEDKTIEIRPIAGTRLRGKSKKEDKELANELLNDEKERAEHLMLVDLGRNDVGKSAKINSVEVKEFMNVEYYSHVMHIISDIQGTLSEDKDVLDALYSGFPAGTLTGAPKIRAMEIIHELEPCKRGVYSGAIGYFDFTGDLNTCIAIRTMVLKNEKVYFQSGAGIVYDSDPIKEYEETINKAKAINSAINFAENGLVK